MTQNILNSSLAFSLRLEVVFALWMLSVAMLFAIRMVTCRDHAQMTAAVEDRVQPCEAPRAATGTGGTEHPRSKVATASKS